MSEEHLEQARRMLDGDGEPLGREHESRLAAIATRFGLSGGEQVSVYRLANLHGSAWADIRDDPDAVELATKNLFEARGKYKGKVPEGWTDTLHCPHCGPVAIWPGGGQITDAVGCPWCPVRGWLGYVPEEARRCGSGSGSRQCNR